jgi:hypothetical protein
MCGKMKDIFIVMQENGMEELDTLIKKAVRLNSDRINFRGRIYSLMDAKQILIFMQGEEYKIRRTEESIERGPNSDHR